MIYRLDQILLLAFHRVNIWTRTTFEYVIQFFSLHENRHAHRFVFVRELKRKREIIERERERTKAHSDIDLLHENNASRSKLLIPNWLVENQSALVRCFKWVHLNLTNTWHRATMEPYLKRKEKREKKEKKNAQKEVWLFATLKYQRDRFNISRKRLKMISYIFRIFFFILAKSLTFYIQKKFL